MKLRPRISIEVTSYYKTGKYFHVNIRAALKSYAPVLKMPDQMFLACSVQGEFSRMAKVLIRKRVIDNQLQWIFGDGHLVILGEILDTQGQGLESLWLIYSLEEQARLSGGCVHFIPGIGDIKALSASWYVKHPCYASRFSSEGKVMPGTALYGGNYEIARWLRTKYCYLQIGDLLVANSFVIDRINCAVKSWSEMARIFRLSSFIVSESGFVIDQQNLQVYNTNNDWCFNKALECGQVERIMKESGCTKLICQWGGEVRIKVLNKELQMPHTDQSGGPVCMWGRKGEIYQAFKEGEGRWVVKF